MTNTQLATAIVTLAFEGALMGALLIVRWIKNKTAAKLTRAMLSNVDDRTMETLNDKLMDSTEGLFARLKDRLGEHGAVGRLTRWGLTRNENDFRKEILRGKDRKLTMSDLVEGTIRWSLSQALVMFYAAMFAAMALVLMLGGLIYWLLGA